MQNLMQNLGGAGGGAGAAGGSPGGGGGERGGEPDLSGLLNPEVMARLQSSPEIQNLRNDPDLAEFFQDLETQGPMAAMR